MSAISASSQGTTGKLCPEARVPGDVGAGANVAAGAAALAAVAPAPSLGRPTVTDDDGGDWRKASAVGGGADGCVETVSTRRWVGACAEGAEAATFSAGAFAVRVGADCAWLWGC